MLSVSRLVLAQAVLQVCELTKGQRDAGAGFENWYRLMLSLMTAGQAHALPSSRHSPFWIDELCCVEKIFRMAFDGLPGAR